MHEPIFTAYKLRLLWHTNPDFYAIGTVFIGSGGGLQFVDSCRKIKVLAVIILDAAFWLTVGSFLLTVELFDLQLTILAFLLTVGAFLLTALASLLTIGGFFAY